MSSKRSGSDQESDAKKSRTTSSAPPRLNKSTQVVTITFGDCAENHVGMQKLGDKAEHGLSCEELRAAQQRFEQLGCTCEMIDLVKEGNVAGQLEPEPTEACVLIIRNGLSSLLGSAEETDDLMREQIRCSWDTRAFMKGRVVNKKARHNLCFAEEGQEPDYEAGKGRVVAYAAVPLMNRVRQSLGTYFGDKAANLYAEGNLYYDTSQCGIGFHGDAERRIVIAMRLGAPMPLHYQWFQQSKPVGARVKLLLNHGDLYAMSEKAAGTGKNKSFILS